MDNAELGDLAKPIAVADIPKDQRFTWRVVPGKGRYLDAETVGETLKQMCRILRIKDMTERRVFTALTGVRITKAGAFEADIAVLPVAVQPKPRTEVRTPHPSDD